MAAPRLSRVKFWSAKQRPRGVATGNVAPLRVAELDRIFTARWGEFLPDDDAGRDDVAIMVHHLANTGNGKGEPRIRRWIKRRAPWLVGRELAALVADAYSRPRRWKADTLGRRLRLTEQERAALAITTIGAVDYSKARRLTRRRERKRRTKEIERRAKGVRPRHEYLAAFKARPKPWAAAGVSRATWYRRHASGAERMATDG